MKLNDLADVDAAISRARATTATLLQRAGRLKKKRKPAPVDLEELGNSRRSRMGRALDRARVRKILRAWNRDEQIRESVELLHRGELSVDAAALEPGISKKAKRALTDVRVRFRTSQKLRDVARELERPDLEKSATKLEQAGRRGWIGIRQADGKTVHRSMERSGLIKLDPAEGRERGAELYERGAPTLMECVARGHVIHKAVFSEFNVAAGSLAWGKEHIFQHLKRAILERDSKGEVPEDHLRQFPEIVGVMAIQEDPLAADLSSWNVHLNILLVVDPAKCTPLAEELCPIDSETGERKPDPAAAAPGMFSYMKLRHAWGSEQIEIRPIRGTKEDVLGALKECIKYACKTVSEKSLEKWEAKAQEEGAHVPRLPPVLQLIMQEQKPAPARERRPAPAMESWPNARVIEWIDGNKGFRRVRSWGCLYRLGKLPPRGDLDEGIRWIGRWSATPTRVTVQLDIFGSLSVIDSIREDKSRSKFGAPRAQGPPRPPPWAARAA